MSETRDIDIAGWVGRAEPDPVLFLERQAAEIILNAIALAPELQESMLLKGGTLMGMAFDSPRQTADMDFSVTFAAADDVAGRLRNSFDRTLPRAAARLGYADLVLKVQSVKYRPRKDGFAAMQAPALQMRIGYARRGSPQEAHLQRGQCADAVQVDISFNEPVFSAQVLRLVPDGTTVMAYSLIDMIAEKMRALLQQEVRNGGRRDRGRRQDVYDIALLVEALPEDASLRAGILEALRRKCRARSIEPTPASMSAQEVKERARREWASLALEIGELPDFDDRFRIVEAFYRSLPWKES
ncbi:nucleotidyl transferase AbiEii/AbiGii toxin family protein [Magnetospirillum sp. UT-4]|uniref:nucleotidyl transferase AbiEii/AbiGii toxin family protein n=1 Tax=Magnetospirillum sp. UT-4 TaxID=2681467 RepID=UPI00137C59BE|nr:nucleotidyl transferase AbiEii/AbiGii toxin family protein [Magnetospirillum sp. UT-4]CAA7627150.1 conserved hypothetical protein [Magnetospirillum sp. UT-4]